MLEIRDIHEPFIAWLNKAGIPFHRNRPDKKTTATQGDPDFLVTWMSHCVYIECKVPGRKGLSKAQEKRIAYIRAAGNKVVIAYSLEMCIEACKDILCVKDLSGGVEGHAARSVAMPGAVGGENPGRLGVGTENSPPSENQASPAQTFIVEITGVNWVCSGDRTSGGEIKRLRRATIADA